MQKQGIICQTVHSSPVWRTSISNNLFLNKKVICLSHRNKSTSTNYVFLGQSSRNFTVGRRTCVLKSTANENTVELFAEEDELCPVECVKEFKTDDEFMQVLETAKRNNSLVVVDFYRTSCGSCKYIEQGFQKLCKGSGSQDQPVIFLKHNVIDEYDEQSETADRLRIKTVPLFHFYKNGVLLEAFATRDKERILAAITKYTAPAGQEDNGSDS